jgi:transcriptional regulator with XRE-family HTH domain
MDDKEFLLKLGERIAYQRKEKELSQTELGFLINVDRTNISALENGRHNPTALTLRKIADALECEVCEFLK